MVLLGGLFKRKKLKMSYIKTNTISTVIATGVLPNVDIILIGSGATTITGTVPTNSMIAGQAIQIKRNIGSTGTLTLQPQTGQKQVSNGTLGATTTLAATGARGSCVLFVWDGTNLLRLLND